MESQLPSPSYVWGMLPVRFGIELTRHKSEICRLCGLYEEYGSDDGNFNAEREEDEIIDELTKVLVQAVAEDAEVRQISNNHGPRAGRPGEAMIPYLAHALLFPKMRRNADTGPNLINGPAAIGPGAQANENEQNVELLGKVEIPAKSNLNWPPEAVETKRRPMYIVDRKVNFSDPADQSAAQPLAGRLATHPERTIASDDE